jgi:hypothetical protein
MNIVTDYDWDDNVDVTMDDPKLVTYQTRSNYVLIMMEKRVDKFNNVSENLLVPSAAILVNDTWNVTEKNVR